MEWKRREAGTHILHQGSDSLWVGWPRSPPFSLLRRRHQNPHNLYPLPKSQWLRGTEAWSQKHRGLPTCLCLCDSSVEPRVALSSPDESVSQQFLPWSPVVSDIFLRKPFVATWSVAVASVTVTIASRTFFGCLGSLLCLQVLSLSVAGQPSSLFQYQIYRWIHSFNKLHQQIKHGVPPSAQFLFTPTPFALDIETPVNLLSERSSKSQPQIQRDCALHSCSHSCLLI